MAILERLCIDLKKKKILIFIKRSAAVISRVNLEKKLHLIKMEHLESITATKRIGHHKKDEK
jgi:hypothetical protein